LPGALLLAGCSLHRSRVAPPPPARGAVRDSLMQLDANRGDSVAAHGFVDGSTALLRPDVVYLRGNAPAVYGREAARALLVAGLPRPGSIVSWQPLGGELSVDQISGYTYGIAARSTSPTAGGSVIRLDRYIAFWRRTASTPWRIAAYAEVGPGSPTESVFLQSQLVPPAAPATDRIGKLRAQLRSADSSFSDFADRMGLAVAFSTTVAADGALFAGSEVVIGPRAIREFYKAQDGGLALTWRPVFADVAGSGELGFTVGEYVATSRGPSGAAVQHFGKYLTVWKRQSDGSWKFVIDGGNSSPR
jgi:ketosteroid isomerase-like protein